jgi:Ca-activated chloride channel homolog
MTNALAAFHFERPGLLLFLLPALLIWLLARRASDPAARWRRVIAPELLRHLLVGSGRASRMTPDNWLIAGWIIGAIAVAGPTWELQPSPFADAAPSVVVVLEVAASMTGSDLSPTRLDRARQKLKDLLAMREGAATGLVAYAGSSHVVLPPTADSAVVLTMAKALSPDIMPKPGDDDLAEAVVLADRLLIGDPRNGSILVMTDTVSRDDLTRMSRVASRLSHGVTLYALVPPEGDLGAMEEGARALDAGLFQTTIDSSDVAAINRRLERYDRTAEVAGEGRRWKEEGYWLTPILAVLAIGWFRRGWVLS